LRDERYLLSRLCGDFSIGTTTNTRKARSKSFSSLGRIWISPTVKTRQWLGVFLVVDDEMAIAIASQSKIFLVYQGDYLTLY
jgi:hypothetical protein